VEKKKSIDAILGLRDRPVIKLPLYLIQNPVSTRPRLVSVRPRERAYQGAGHGLFSILIKERLQEQKLYKSEETTLSKSCEIGFASYLHLGW
jgi:hypothetical protein